MDPFVLKSFIDHEFEYYALPALMKFIQIPNQSPDFDPDWETNGLAEKAVKHVQTWIENQKIERCKTEIIKEEKKTHLLYFEIQSSDNSKDAVLLYGHLDKQPPLDPSKWNPGLAPYNPTIINNQLFGRGAVDDGYSPFSAILALKAIQKLNLGHKRIIGIFESEEESGSKSLYHYLEKLKQKIGEVSLIICLDSGAHDYSRFWITTSLRGHLKFTLTARMLNEALHSGDVGGVVVDSMRILRILLDRLEDPLTGVVHSSLHVEIPKKRIEELKSLEKLMGTKAVDSFKLLDKAQPVSSDPFELKLNRAWKPALMVLGANGMPPLESAGNVLRKETSLKVSIRLPPTKDPNEACEQVKKLVTENVPYCAQVEMTNVSCLFGVYAREFPNWIENLVNETSKTYFYGNKSE